MMRHGLSDNSVIVDALTILSQFRCYTLLDFIDLPLQGCEVKSCWNGC